MAKIKRKVKGVTQDPWALLHQLYVRTQRMSDEMDSLKRDLESNKFQSNVDSEFLNKLARTIDDVQVYLQDKPKENFFIWKNKRERDL